MIQTWLYQHASYVICSSVKVSNFRDVFPVKLKDTEYPLCSYSYHDHFRVYFEDNICLKKYPQHSISSTVNQERRTELQIMLQKLEACFTNNNTTGTPFETPALRGIHFGENDWTKRLSQNKDRHKKVNSSHSKQPCNYANAKYMGQNSQAMILFGKFVNNLMQKLTHKYLCIRHRVSQNHTVGMWRLPAEDRCLVWQCHLV